MSAATTITPAGPPGAHRGQPRTDTTTGHPGTQTGTFTRTRLARGPRAAAFDVLVMTVLLAIGVVSFAPAFDGAPGYLAAGGGVAIGVLVGCLAAWRRWGLAATAALTLALYVACGGALALPRTTVYGVLPTGETVQRLVVLTWEAWRDLLTVSIPAASFTGPAVVPYFSGVVCAVLCLSGALRLRWYLWGLAPAAALLLIGILWGTRDAPYAVAQGAAFALVSVAWAAARVALADRRESSEILGLRGGTAAGTARLTRLAIGVAVLALAGGLGVVAGPALVGQADRQVLRDKVTPPLDLAQYPSPLSGYRYLERDLNDKTLFTVGGLPEGARIRLAALDVYDGNVYNVDQRSADFRRVGDRIGSTPDPEDLTRLTFSIDNLTGVWLPGGGDVRGLRFSGSAADRLAEGLYYNKDTGTLLTTGAVGPGVTYAVDAVLTGPPSDEVLGDTPVE